MPFLSGLYRYRHRYRPPILSTILSRGNRCFVSVSSSLRLSKTRDRRGSIRIGALSATALTTTCLLSSVSSSSSSSLRQLQCFAAPVGVRSMVTGTGTGTGTTTSLTLWSEAVSGRWPPERWDDNDNNDNDDKEEALRRCFLPLSAKSHKGSSGRVGVLGGSARYTGAPYYAAMASLQAGADLAFVFCAEEAAVPIKCYSPELMVAAVYRASDFDRAVQWEGDDGERERTRLVQAMVSEVEPLMPRMHVLIVGPGLGRCPLVLRATEQLLQIARSRRMPVVVDADALHLLSSSEVLRGYARAILTPNAVEYDRLFRHNDNDNNRDRLQRTVVVRKGARDEVFRVGGGTDPDVVAVCTEEGGLKRSGGIGDVLAGVLGTLAAWNHILHNDNHTDNHTDTHDNDDERDLIWASWSACCVVKRATKAAFERKKRSMTAPDVLQEIGRTMDIMTTTSTEETQP